MLVLIYKLCLGKSKFKIFHREFSNNLFKKILSAFEPKRYIKGVLNDTNITGLIKTTLSVLTQTTKL